MEWSEEKTQREFDRNTGMIMVKFYLNIFERWSKMNIKEAEKNDLQKILDLQYLAYQSEAKLFNNPDIPPLKQTLAEIENEFQKGVILKAVDENNTIIGSVRAYYDNDTV